MAVFPASKHRVAPGADIGSAAENGRSDAQPLNDVDAWRTGNEKTAGDGFAPTAAAGMVPSWELRSDVD